MSENLGLKIQIVADADTKGFDSTTDAAKDLTKQVDKGSDSTKTFGGNLEEAGEKSEQSHQKHLHFRQLLGELNQISPGLGHAMHLVAEAYNEAGGAAEGGAVGVRTFNTALGEVISTMGPLIVAMLGIEAALKLWESYKEGVEKAAKAQEEATKRIVDSTRDALKAVRELEEALHPKEKSLAEKDEENLKRQLEQQEHIYQREKEINKQREQNALAVATPEQKKGIEEQFADLDKGLAIWNQKMRANIAGTMAEAMTGQITEVESKLLALKGQSDDQLKILNKAPAEIKDLKTQKSDLFSNPDAAPSQEAVDALNKQIATKQAALDASQAEYDRVNREIENLKKKAGPLGDKRESIQGQADTDADNADAATRTGQIVGALRLTGRVNSAITNEQHASTVEEAKQALQESQAVGRQLVAAIHEAHATNSGTQRQLLAAYHKLRDENTRMTEQIRELSARK